MMRLNIKKNPKFALVGHGYHLNFFFDELIKNRLPKPIIITVKKKDIRLEKNIVLKKFVGKTLYNFPNELTKSLSDNTSVFNFR